MDEEQNQATKEYHGRLPRKFYLALASLFLIEFVASFNSVVLASALPAIVSDLNAPSDKAFWTGTAFLVCQTVTTPMFGVFSDFLGRKIILLANLGAFMIAGVLCSTAQSIDWLLGARVLQGISAGGLHPVVFVVLVDLVPLRDRGKVDGLWMLAHFLGLPSGLIAGGLLSQSASWRWVFFLTIPVSAISFIGILLTLTLASPEISVKKAVEKLDWIGLCLFTGSIVSLLIGIVGGGNIKPWSSPKIIIPIVFGALGVGAFIVFERYFTCNPVVPLRLFGNRTAVSGFISAWIHGFVFWSSSYYLIIYFLGAQGHSLLVSSADILPAVFTLVLSALAGGIAFSWLKRFQKLMWAAWGLTTVGLALMTLLRPTSSPAEQFLFPVVASIGGGVILPGRLLAVQAAQKDEDAPLATTMVSFMLSLGQAFGVGVGGSILENRWNHLIAKNKASISAKFVISGKDLLSAWRKVSAFPPNIQYLYREITADSISALYVVLAVLAGIGLVTSFLSEDLTLDKDARGRQRFVMEHDDSGRNIP